MILKNDKKRQKSSKTDQKYTPKIFKQKKRIRSKYWRLVIPNLSKKITYEKFSKSSKLPFEKLKLMVLKLLRLKEFSRGLKYYSIAVEKHLSGKHHLDILMIYENSVLNSYKRYDYIIKHGDLTRYSTINESIMKYNLKEDIPLTNFKNKMEIIIASSSLDLFQKFIIKKMKEDPFKFRFWNFIYEFELESHLLKFNLQKIEKIVKKIQQQHCRKVLQLKSGIPLITPELIRKTLTPTQYTQYKSWPKYDVIITYINQIVKWGWNRPHKTRNLYLVGPTNTGKTTLLNTLEKHVSTYNLGIKGGWFPGYDSRAFKLLRWDEFNLSTYKYSDLLRLLEGIPMKLPVKGGHVIRGDNQLIIMNSNLKLKQHIEMKFRKPHLVKQAVSNLSTRITQIVVPKNKNLFLLLPLIKKLKNQ